MKAIAKCSLALAFLAAPLGARACGPEALGTARVIRMAPSTPVGLKTYPRTLALADKELVLTFDDGPLPATTNKVLDILKAECVKATFFLIGRNADANPQIARRIVAEGHTLGHHSYSHPSVTLRGLSVEAAKADIDRGIAADARAGFGAVDAAAKAPFFRYPGFGDAPALNEYLAQKGMTVFGADLWSSDWEPMSADAQYELLLARIGKARKGIVLMHDTKQQTADSLARLLRTLKERGYRIVHIAPGDAPAELVKAGPKWSSETERTLARMWPKAPPTQGARPKRRRQVDPNMLAR